MKKELATVVIPIHLEEPTYLEKFSLSQTLKVLGKYPITFMTRAGLKTTWYKDFCQGKAEVHFEEFKWQGFDEFGELMTSAKFYQPFRKYEYMLICHLDAFVFRDELERWCQYDYDYIGSYIYNTHWDGVIKRFHRLMGFRSPEYYANGGFALKKVDTWYRIASKFSWYIRWYHIVRRFRKRGFLDDIFVAELFPSLSKSFRVPPAHLCQKFGAAYEVWNEKDLPFTNGDCSTLPFGVHGFIKWNPDFWKPCLRQYGYPWD